MNSHPGFFSFLSNRKKPASALSGCQTPGLSEHRSSVVDALNKAIDIFSTNREKTFDEVMTHGIRPIADAVGLDRVVFYTLVERDGVKRLGQVYRWDRSEGGLMSLAEELRVMPNVPFLENWILILSKGGRIRFRKRDYTEDVAAFLRVYGIKSILMIPVFTHGEFWGVVSFQDHTIDRYFDEDCDDLLYSAALIFTNAIIRAGVSRAAEEAFEALKRREKMAAALNRAAIGFLSQSEDTFEDTMTEGVKEIADVLDLDRFSIWRNFRMPDVMHVSQIYRWDRKSGGTTEPTTGLEDVTYDQLAPRWEKLLASGETINSPVRLLPEAAMLQSFGTVTVFITPIFINNIFWGFALLEDRHTERFFEEDSVEMMRSAAFLCVNTVIRADMERDIANANEFTRAILDASPLGFTAFDENARIADCNDFILKALGTTKNYFIEYFHKFSPEYQSNGDRSIDKAIELIERALGGERLVFEWTHRSSSGELIPYEITLIRTMYKGKYMAMAYQYDMRNTKKMMESIREQSELLKMRLEQQELISELSRGFISSGDSQMLVKEAIAKLGRYHDVSLVFIFAMDYERNDTYLAYNWCAYDVTPRNLIDNLFEYVKSVFPETLPDSAATMPIIACDDTAANPGTVFQTLASIDVMAVITAPLYVEGRLWGIISVEQNSRPRRWTENEKRFVALTASTIAGVIMRDIYTIKLKEALHDATVASKAKGEFLSNISHEMRTPLNAIIGMTEIGKKADDLAKKNHALNRIDEASTHLLGIINDVLDMSKIEANKLELSFIDFSFEKMIRRVVNVVSFRVDEKKQNLSIKIDRDVPETLIGDDQRLAQVIANLLGNAVKFTPEKGSISLDASLEGEENGLCVIRVSVGDTGIGISAEQQKKLFQSFQQAESSTVRKYGGTGLGLAISKNIVEMMGGRIWVQSEQGKGATFTFTVKLKRGKDEYPGAEEQEEMNVHRFDGAYKGRRLLLAEDVEINREIVLTLLEPTLLEIECAENGTQAVSMFAEAPKKYDLILMDIQMPEMDGYEATRRIRAFEAEHGSASERPKGVPIIAMTANVFREDIERCLEAGMDDHLGKPLDINAVMEKLHTYIT